MLFRVCLLRLFFPFIVVSILQPLRAQSNSAPDAACHSLLDMPDLTVVRAEIKKAAGSASEYCYVKGVVLPSTVFHVQLPLPDRWNGRFLEIGDGGKDGDLDFANPRVADGRNNPANWKQDNFTCQGEF